MSRTFCVLVAVGALGCAPALAQLTLEQTVAQATSKYPAVKVSLEQVAAAAAGINLARTSYLPRADFLGQVNRATHNNCVRPLIIAVDTARDFRPSPGHK